MSDLVKLLNQATGKIEEYKLRITLGFWKKLSFPKAQIQEAYVDGNKLIEVIKLAVFFGNKQDKGWHCLADMEKEITEESLEDIDDNNIVDKVDNAIFLSFSDKLQEKIKKEQEEIDTLLNEENSDLKKN